MEYGYIDKTGNFVIQEQFQSARDFTEDGLAIVCIGRDDDQKCGFIDKSGKYVINRQYRAVSNFDNGLAMVREIRHAYIDRTGKMVWKGEAEQVIRFNLSDIDPTDPFEKYRDPPVPHK